MVTMTQSLVSKTEFGDISGRTASGALRWLSRNAPDAVHGNQVDIAHPKVAKYIAKAATAKTAAAANRRNSPATAQQRHRNWVFVEMSQIENLTVGELINKYGSMPEALAFVEFHQKVLAVRERELKLAKEAGKVVSREYVERYVFGALNNLFTVMLSDQPQRLALQVSELVRAGASVTKVQAKIHDETSKVLRSAKQKIEKVIGDA